MTHEIDFNEAAALGWEIEPRFQARKGDQVFVGTAAALSTRIAEHEQREALVTEQREHTLRREQHAPVTRLVRLLDKLEEEHQRELNKYLDEATDHHTRMRHLDGATALRKRQVDTWKQLFEHSKEVLLANDDFLGLQAALRES